MPAVGKYNAIMGNYNIALYRRESLHLLKNNTVYH